MQRTAISRRAFVEAAGVAAGVALVANAPFAAAADGVYAAGVYTASGRGIGGDVPVTVEFSQDAILSVEVGENSETQGIGSNAIDQLPSMIVEAQSTNIDVVSGATVTSNAILNAVDDCIAQATGTADESNEVSFEPGVYSTTTRGMMGEFEVSAEFTDTAIEGIEVGENSETLMVGSAAIDVLSELIVDSQTLKVDSVTGATYSSAAIIGAVENLVEQAGGDVKSFSVNAARVETYTDDSHEADIIIVGGGLAGSCAAIAAAQGGASVIVLESLQFAAGNSSLSSGLFLLGNTDIQKAAGVEQTTEEFYEYVLEASDNQKDPEKVRILADNCQNLIDWFKDIGVQFSDEMTSGMHGLYPSIGAALQTMNKVMVDLGVSIRYGTKGQDLIFGDEGEVVGVKATDYYGNEVEYTGKKIVLACGGYGDNPDLIAQTWGEEYRGLVYGGLKGMDGTMLLAAMNAGAGTCDMEWPHVDACLEVNKGVTITTTLLSGGGGILIRTDGKRFCEETANHSEVASATMHELGDEYFYEIYDAEARNVSSSLAYKFDTYSNMGLPGIYDSIEEMAEGIGVDYEALNETIENYNAAVRGEQEDEFGRTTFYEELNAPFYVVKVSNGVACTTGGLTVDTENQVLTVDGNPIENLYAIGEIAGGMLIGYIGGESLSNSSITGMLLGQRLAGEVTIA